MQLDAKRYILSIAFIYGEFAYTMELETVQRKLIYFVLKAPGIFLLVLNDWTEIYKSGITEILYGNRVNIDTISSLSCIKHHLKSRWFQSLIFVLTNVANDLRLYSSLSPSRSWFELFESAASTSLVASEMLSGGGCGKDGQDWQGIRSCS